ncbi:hypothetical protein B0G93_12424 [Bacillus sp. V-88]|jgi:hypothetical protein|nr:hypothetical protein B1B00_17940 [Bacillus sp. DSM 27956]PRX71769.1 hypothetical protein B0G93_12424 [Bacillus sp. V-88]SLK24405.1 hypothetical protein SAMN06295884_12424 [Bacillus sp. V-88]
MNFLSLFRFHFWADACFIKQPSPAGRSTHKLVKARLLGFYKAKKGAVDQMNSGHALLYYIYSNRKEKSL